MRSRRHPRAITVLAVALSILALASCSRGPRAVPLDELAADPDAFHDQTVSTTGRVTQIQDGTDATARHFVLEDRDANRVLLLPDHMVERFAGQFVRVVGTFSFDETVGRRLRIDEISRPRA